MSFLKIVIKTGIAVIATTYAACILNDVTVIDYTATEEGGTLSIAGCNINVTDDITEGFMETYTKVEEQATKWLPGEIRTAVEQLSELFNGGD